jgi:hypothetical protein
MSTATQAAPISVMTAGAICQLLQTAPARILAALRALNAQPRMVVNGVAHYDEALVPQVREWLTRPRGPDITPETCPRRSRGRGA